MTDLVIAGDTSGSITLRSPAVSGSSVLTLPVATDTLVGKATTDTLTNKTLTTPVIATITNSGTLTLPTSTDTLVGRATTDTLTNKTLTAPTITGANITVASTAAPAFSARNNTTQSFTTGVITKVTFGTEDFDTNSNFASSRFTPTVEGYYQINGVLYSQGTAATYGYCFIHKNGVQYQIGTFNQPYASTTASISVISAVLYCNGTTDYVELYGQGDGSTPTFIYVTASICARFSGAMIRSA